MEFVWGFYEVLARKKIPKGKNDIIYPYFGLLIGREKDHKPLKGRSKCAKSMRKSYPPAFNPLPPGFRGLDDKWQSATPWLLLIPGVAGVERVLKG